MDLGEYLEEKVREDGAESLADERLFGENALDKIGAQSGRIPELRTDRYRSNPLDSLYTMYLHREDSYRPTFVEPSYREFDTEVENGVLLDHCAIMGTPQQVVWMKDTGSEEQIDELISDLQSFTENNRFFLEGSDIKPNYNGVKLFSPTSVWDFTDEVLSSGLDVMYPANLGETMRRNGVPDYAADEVERCMANIGNPVSLENYFDVTEDGAIARAAEDHGLTVVSVDKDFPLGKKDREQIAKM